MRRFVLPLLLLFSQAVLAFPHGEVRDWRQQMLDAPELSLNKAQALLASPDDRQRLLALLAMAEAHAWQGQGQAGKEKALAGLELASRLGDKGFQVAFHNALARSERILGHYQEALGWTSRSESLLEALADPLLAAEHQAEIGETHLNSNRYGQALSAFERAYELVLSSGETDHDLAPVLNYLALTYDALAQYDKAADYYRQVLKLLGDGSRAERAVVLYNLAMAEKELKHRDQAEALLEESLALSLLTQNEVGAAYAEGQLGLFALDRGDFEQARRRLDQALASFEQQDNPHQSANALLGLAELAIQEGQADRALALLARSQPLVAPVDSKGLRRHYLEVRFKAERAAGHTQAALDAIVALRETEKALQEERQAITSEAMAIRMTSLEKSHEIERLKGQQLLAEEKQSHERRFFLVATLVLLALLFNAFFWLRKERGNRKLLGLMAHQDELTGQPNRRAIMAELKARLDRQRGHPLAVAMLDLDHFKQINDRHGHDVGDQALKHFAKVTDSCLRQKDSLGRLGGEEWLLLLPYTELARAREVVERLQQALRESPLRHQDQDIRLQLSAGLTQAEPGETICSLLKRADQAMYQAKAQGRDRLFVLSAAQASR
ncbi:tetratricopeptide repeat-containing diguanylate cyclase [Gallaecimonas sp. GXIMD4217]|uniref:tetratricopeptide repeat-containing diguanylate cyclase n=1 Tax=Gallaecimonas sp. GXIMD4217 TaxID=3131927 RepID=UPI00311AF167